jgi:hypothetical protein
MNAFWDHFPVTVDRKVVPETSAEREEEQQQQLLLLLLLLLLRPRQDSNLRCTV